MNTLTHLFFLAGYIVLSFFWFVEREDFTAGLIWLGLTLLAGIAKPLRRHLKLLLLIGACFSLFYALEGSGFLRWPFDFFVSTLFGYCFLRFILRSRPPKLRWSFKFSKIETLSILLINIPAIFILYWYYQGHPEVAKTFPDLPGPAWSLPLMILLAASINGLREEIFYRGLLQSVSSESSPGWYVIALQSVLFGFLHFGHSFPQGWIGVFLTGIWGAAIAMQFRIFKSISLAWVTHAVADAIMFTIILYGRR